MSATFQEALAEAVEEHKDFILLKDEEGYTLVAIYLDAGALTQTSLWNADSGIDFKYIYGPNDWHADWTIAHSGTSAAQGFRDGLYVDAQGCISRGAQEGQEVLGRSEVGRLTDWLAAIDKRSEPRPFVAQPRRRLSQLAHR